MNSNEPTYFIFTVSVNICGGMCCAIDDEYGQICVPERVRNMNVEVFNLMYEINETRLFISV